MLLEHLGGSGLHTAVNLAQLQHHHVLLFGGVGDTDAFGKFLLSQVGDKAVDATHVKCLRGSKTAATMVLSGQADRSFVSLYGATAVFSLKDVDVSVLLTMDHVHFAGFFQSDGLRGDLEGLMKSLRERGVTISLDTGYDESGRFENEVLERVLHLVDVFLPNTVEALGVAKVGDDVEKALEVLSSRYGIRVVVIKRGELGAVLRTKDGRRLEQSAFAVDVVDTTGAGDCFNAGFLDAFVRGEPLEEALKLASALGSMVHHLADRSQLTTCFQSVRAAGASEQPHTMEQVQAFIAQRGQ